MGAVGNDLRDFRAAVGLADPLRPGLHTFHFALPQGRRRFHLRIGSDGSGLLLVDVTEAIHLNATATLLVQMALRRVSQHEAAAALRRRFRKVEASESIRQAEKVYALVGKLTSAAGPCTTCDLRGVQWSPSFTLPISAPFKADLALTYGCNNACPHCYNRSSRSQAETVGRDSSFNTAQWGSVLRRLSAIGIPHVIFTGGEPTLFESLAELIGTAARLGLITGLNTNGRRLSSCRFAASLKAAGLDHVQITLESHLAEVHNAMTGAASFDETLEGIRSAVAVGLHTITNTTLTRQNIDHAHRIVDLLYSLGVRTFAMNGMIYAGRASRGHNAVAPEALTPVLADVRDRARALGMRFLWYTPTEYCRLSPVEWELGPRRCNAGQYSICIEPNGDVLPCQSYYTAAGNILRDPWEQIWQSELFRGFRRRVSEPQAAGLPEQCWACPDLELCGGGCKIERESKTLPVACEVPR